jgi:hypothetical protein
VEFKSIRAAHLQGCEAVVKDESQNQARDEEKLNTECVVVSIITAAKLFVNEENGRAGRRDEQNFHDAVVQRNEDGK